MVRFSNNLIAVLNILTLILSIPIIGGGIWLSYSGATDCEKFLEVPLIALGVFILAISIAGFAGACCKNSCLLWIYLLVMFLLILLLFCFAIFAFIVTNNGAAQVVSSRGFKEYRLGDYSNWLQKRIDNTKNWRKIKSCIQDAKVCKSLQDRNMTFTDFYKENLSPIQSGCCKPPMECNLTYGSETVWNKPARYISGITDCNTWNNDPTVLCYDCQSCKAGFIANLRHDWKKIAIVNIIFLIFLIVVYSVGCCAFRNNRLGDRREKAYYPGFKGYP